MSRREYNHSPILFEDGRETYRRDDRDCGGHGRQDDSQSVRDNSDRDTRHRNGIQFDSHGDYHEPFLNENFVDGIAETISDPYHDQRNMSSNERRYADNRYDDYESPRRVVNYSDDKHYDRYENNPVAKDKYVPDNYDDRRVDGYGTNDGRYDTNDDRYVTNDDRYITNDDKYGQNDSGYGQDDRIYNDNYRTNLDGNVGDSYYGQPSDADSRAGFYDDRIKDVRDNSRRNDNKEKDRTSLGKRNESHDREGRFGRESRDLRRRNDKNMSSAKDRVSSSERYPKNSSLKQTVEVKKVWVEPTFTGNYKRQGTDKTLRRSNISKGRRQESSKNRDHSKAPHEKSDTRSKVTPSQSNKTHHKSSKTSSDSKTDNKRMSSERRGNQQFSASNKNTDKFVERDLKVSDGGKKLVGTKIAGHRSSSRRDSVKSSKSDIQRRHTSSSGDQRDKSKTDPVRKSVSRSSVARSNFDGKSEHKLNRPRNSGGPMEMTDENPYHDDDVLSILADDDRFARETRGLLGDGVSRNESFNSRPSQANCQRFSDRYSPRINASSLDKQSGIDKGVGVRGTVPDEKNVRKFNTANVRHNMSRTGFYKRKTVNMLRKNATINRNRASRFTEPDKRYIPDERSHGMISNETDDNYFRDQTNYVNEKSNDARHKSGNVGVTGKKYMHSGGVGKGRGAYGKFYGKSRGPWNNKTGKNNQSKGFSKHITSKDKYANSSTNRAKNTFSQGQREKTDNYYNDIGDDGKRYDDRHYDADENIDFHREGAFVNAIDGEGIGDTGQQQIIFIPNPDFQGNVDSYGNIINPDNQGNLQQVPFQLLPTNMPSENTQRSDQLMFIPFVNNQLKPEDAVPVQLNSDGQIQTQAIAQNVEKPNTNESKGKTASRQKGLTAVQRSKLNKKLMLKRRQRLEKQIERKVLKKLLENASTGGLSSMATKAKATIKRISPPAKKGSVKVSNRKLTDLEDVTDEEKEKYDDVSDLDSVSDDEDGFNRRKSGSGSQRKAFRKPGEPRISKRPITQNKSDVRRVVDTSVEKKKNEASSEMSERYSRGRKRTVHEMNNDEKSSKMINSDGKKWERGRSNRQDERGHGSMSPLQITVNNDKFSSPADRNKRKRTSDRVEKRNPDNKYSDQGHSKIGNKSSQRDSLEEYDYPDNDDDDDDDNDDEWRRARSDGTRGKYASKGGKRDERSKYKDDNDDEERRRKQEERDREYHRRRRDSSDERRADRKNRSSGWLDERHQRYSPQPQQIQQPLQQAQLVQNQGLIQQNQALLSNQQSFQQAILTSQPQQLSNQFQSNISNLSLVNTGNSIDPSLPPVMNVPQLSQSNLMLRPDMSLPPPQVSVIGNQTSLSQLAYQPGIEAQSVLSLQNSTLQSNQQQLQQASLQQQQQQLLQLQQQALMNTNRNQLNGSPAVNQALFQSPVQQSNSTPLFQSAAVQQNPGNASMYTIPSQQNNQQTGSQLQQIQSNLGSQINLGQMQYQQETPKPLMSISAYNQQNASNNNQSAENTNSASQYSSRTQNQGVGVIGTLSSSQRHASPLINKPKPLIGSLQVQGNQSGVGSEAEFKGQVYNYQANTSYRSRNETSPINRSPVTSSQHSKYDSRYGSGKGANLSAGSSRTSNQSSGASRTINQNIVTGRTTNQSSGTGRTTNQSSGTGRTINQGSGTSRSFNLGSGTSRTINQSSGTGRTINQGSGSGRTSNQSSGSCRPTNQSSGASRSTNQSSGASRPTNQNSGASRSTNHISGSGRTAHQGSGSNRTPNQHSGAGRMASTNWKHGGNGNKEVESDGDSDDDDVGQLMCTKCDKFYLSRSVMRKHARWHDRSASGQHDVRCDRCELAFSTPSLNDDHCAEKHCLEAWNCHLCDLTFPHSQALVRHFQKENHLYVADKYICPTCSAMFKSLKLLAHHKQAHQSALRQPGSSRRIIAKFV